MTKKHNYGRWITVALILLAVLLYFCVPSVKNTVDTVTSVLGSANVDAVIEYIRSFGAFAVVVSFSLMVFSSLLAPLPAFLITFPMLPFSAGGRALSCPGAPQWWVQPFASSSHAHWVVMWWKNSQARVRWQP